MSQRGRQNHGVQSFSQYPADLFILLSCLYKSGDRSPNSSDCEKEKQGYGDVEPYEIVIDEGWPVV